MKTIRMALTDKIQYCQIYQDDMIITWLNFMFYFTDVIVYGMPEI